MFTNLLAWVQSLISDAVEALVNLVLGHIANLNGLEGFVQIFPVAGTLYSYLQTVGMLMVVLIAAIGLYKFFFTPDAQDSPIRIGAMVAASVVCIYSGNYALEAIFNLANTVFTALKDVNAVQMNLHLTGLGLLEGTAEAGAAIAGGPAVGTALVVGAGVMALLSIIYAILVWMTMWKLIKICVGHYVYIGVLIFTSPVAWPTMISRSTSPIFSRWISLFAGECMCYILSVFGIKMALSAFAIGQIAGRTDTVQADIVVRIIAGNVIVQVVTSIDSWLKSVGVGAMPVSSGGGGVLAPLGAAVSLVGTNLARNATRSVWEGTGVRSKVEGLSAAAGRHFGWRGEAQDLADRVKAMGEQQKVAQMHGNDTANAFKDAAKATGIRFDQTGLTPDGSGKSNLAEFAARAARQPVTDADLANRDVRQTMNGLQYALRTGELTANDVMSQLGNDPIKNEPMAQMLTNAAIADQLSGRGMPTDELPPEIASTFDSMKQEVEADVADGYTKMSDSLAPQIRNNYAEQVEDALKKQDKKKLADLGFNGQGNSTTAEVAITEFNKGNMGDQIKDFRNGNGSIEGGNTLAGAFENACANRGEQLTKSVLRPEQHKDVAAWAQEHGSDVSKLVNNFGLGTSTSDFMSDKNSYSTRSAVFSALERSAEGRSSPVSAMVSGISAEKINIELSIKGQNKQAASLSAGMKKPLFGIIADK